MRVFASKNIAAAIHPRTKRVEQARYLRDHFGEQKHGWKFHDGSIWRAENVETPKRDPFVYAEGVDM